MTPPPMKIKLDTYTLEGVVVAKINPQGYLGDLFHTFKAASEGAGGRYHHDLRLNYCPLVDVARVSTALKAAGFLVSGTRDLVERLAALKSDLTARDGVVTEIADEFHAALTLKGLKLFPYQREGARQLALAVDGFALFDDMGLGKTVQLLASLPREARVVVVSPKSAKAVWKLEAPRWRRDLRVTVLEGKKSFRWPEVGEIVVLNYQILPVDVVANCPQGVVLVYDEAQHLRNGKSAMSQRGQILADHVRKHAGKAILLTATPVDNNPWELWTLCKIAGTERRIFGGFAGFLALFRGSKSLYGYEFGLPDTDALRERLLRATLRRTKDDVLKELPAKTRQRVPVPISNALASKLTLIGGRVVADVAAGLSVQQSPSFTEYSKVYEALTTAMIPAMLETVEQCEDSKVPLVVFSPHLAPIHALEDRPGWVTITGATSDADREDYVRRFQAGELLGIAGTIRAMGTALTLTRSSTVLFVNRSFVPGENDQAEDRCRRLGQKSAVTVLQLIADHELALRISEILGDKQDLIDGSVGASAIGADDRIASPLELLQGLPLG